MRNLILAIAQLVGFMLSTMTASAADGVRLFEQASIVARDEEVATLNLEERKSLAFVRGKPEMFADAQVIKLNLAALASGAITITLPNGKTVQFVGAMGTKPGHVGVWYGKSTSGEIYIASDDVGTHVSITDGAKGYMIASLPGKRYHFISRVLPQRFSEDPNEPREEPTKSATRAKGAAK